MSLGNFAVQEVLYGVAEDFDGNLLYTLDQLSSAQIEISSDPTEITDKNGNVIKQIFKSKTGTFTATSALLSPAIMNAGSGSDAKEVEKADKVSVPKIEVVAKSAEIALGVKGTDYVDGTVKVIPIESNGANGKALDSAAVQALITTDSDGKDKITLPGTGTMYLVKYERYVDATIMENRADKFPSTVRLTLYVALADPCADEPRAAYVYIPSFQADPSVTISLDSESTEVDFSGSMQVDYCSCGKQLYTIYLPDENAVVTTDCAE